MTDELQIRKELETPEINILISAGAGAGKTELMAKAVLNRLNSERDLKETEVVVITFTNAAAEELRERINSKYIERKKDDTSFRKINTDDINVSTIHSFCNSLIRQKSFDIGLGAAPDYSDNEKEEFHKSIRQFARSYMENNDDLLKLIYHYWGWNTKNIIFENFEIIAEKPGLKIIEEKLPDEAEIKSNFEKLENLAEKFTVAIIKAFEGKKKAAYREEGLAMYSEWKNFHKDYAGLLRAMEKLSSAKNSKSNQNIKDLYSLLENEISIFKNNRVCLTTDYIRRMYLAWEKYHNKLPLNTDSILFKTAELLKNHPDTIGFFQEKYKVFFVDEFQDTDYLQLRILLQLCTTVDSNGNTVLKDKTLFLVGDPKQSIYHFRGAEFAFYEYMIKNYFSDNRRSKYCQLNMNFRSQKEMVEYVNKKYNHNGQFGYASGKMDISTPIPYQNMIAGFGCDDTSLPEENTICGGVSGENEDITKTIPELIQFISELKEKNIRLLYKNNHQTGYQKRPVLWSDFLILTPYRKTAANIYKELKKHGIPTIVSGDNDLSESRAILRVKALIDYLRNGSMLHTARLVSAFSPKGGTKLDSKGLTDNKGTLFDMVTEAEAERIKRIIDESTKIYSSDDCNIMEVLFHALSQGWLTDNTFSYISAVSELPVLYQFFEGMYSHSCDHIDAVKEYVENFISQKHTQLLNPSKSTNCVRVMNTHQAKGLEGNIVINYQANSLDKELQWLDTSQIRNNYSEYLTEENGNIVIHEKPHIRPLLKVLYKFPTRSQYVYYNCFDDNTENKIRTEEKNETLREMYVNDTRAKVHEYIILQKKDDGKFASTFNACPVSYKISKSSFIPYFTDEQRITTSPSRLEKNDFVDKKQEELIVEQENSNNEKIQEKNASNGALYGTIMHRAFELYLANRKLYSDEDNAFFDLEAFVMQAMIENNAVTENLDTLYEPILKNLRIFVKEFEENYSKSETACETPIYCVFHNTNSENDKTNSSMMELINETQKPDNNKISTAFFNGYSDLIVFEGSKASIIDYKSDRIRQDETTDEYTRRLTNKYKPQQKAYALCMDKLIGHVEQRMILYTANGETLWISENY